ncbi:NYN domain-containing protein [Kocuria palustris]|uniref:NYN domain-containing protein n=1 Tax=Kocuria palustris TaxID=71999 RepID=UPI0022FFD57C|nr:NYN domain-containing protein [Kocuria palustris]
MRAAVIIDYQNVHLTAWEVFNRAGERHESLIHPRYFADISIQTRNQRQREGYPHAILDRVVAFRGLPHVDYDWEQNRRCLDQAQQWRNDGAEVELRDLKYKHVLGADGRPILNIHGKKEAKGRGKEKGIDVLCALTCVREALRPDIDVVMLASRDTDLVPTLDTIVDMHHDHPGIARIETLSWFNKTHPTKAITRAGSLHPAADDASGTPTLTVAPTKRH